MEFLYNGQTIKQTLYNVNKDFARTFQYSCQSLSKVICIKRTLFHSCNGVRFREISPDIQKHSYIFILSQNLGIDVDFLYNMLT